MERKTSMIILMAALAELFFIATPAAAQPGFSLGVSNLFISPGGDLNNLEAGNGLGVHGGYGVNRYLSFEAAYFRTTHSLKSGDGNVYLHGNTMDAKVNVPLNGSNIEPYLRGGVGRYSIDHTDSGARGKGRHAGIGLDIVLFPELKIYVGLVSRRMNFTTVPNMKVGASCLEYGLTFYFL